jgi:hypothetical protein
MSTSNLQRTMTIDLIVSRNFETAKVAAILAVTCGHFLPYASLWVVASIALCLFGFTSGYFTALIYGASPEPLTFVRNKLQRLGPDLLAINLLLLALFLLQGRPDIFSWQSLLGVLGLSGWLNWLYLPNPSPFGAGLWYFSLLLLFYVCYPLLTKLLRGGKAGAVVTFLLLLLALLLSDRIRFGHMLWFTAFSFCFGVTYANQQWRAGIKSTILLTAALSLGFVLANIFFGVPVRGLLLVGVASLLCIQVLMVLPLPDWLHAPLKPFGACVLEIYFLHTYLFVHPIGVLALDLFASLALILIASLLTRRFAEWIQAWQPRRAG